VLNQGTEFGAENGADETYLRACVAFQILCVGPIVEILSGDHQVDIRRTDSRKGLEQIVASLFRHQARGEEHVATVAQTK